MSETPARLVFNKPTKDQPGFLRRALNAGRARQLFNEGNPEPLVDFFLDYVTSHPRDVAKEILLDLSEDDFNQTIQELMDAFEGKASSPAARSNGNLTAASGPVRGRKRTGRSS